MKNLIIPILSLLLIFSCKKKETPEPTPEAPAPPSAAAYTVKDYFPLKYGNYWVYERTITDTNGVITSTMIDSCYVYDSLLVHSKWFYKVDGFVTIQGYFIDSANCIINNGGGLYMNMVNNDTIAKVFWSQPGGWFNEYVIMKTTPTTFVFNSNTYSNCISRYTYFYSNMNPNCPNWIIYNTYSPGIGMVYSKYGFINSCDVWEDKLLRYKIN